MAQLSSLRETFVVVRVLLLAYQPGESRAGFFYLLQSELEIEVDVD